MALRFAARRLARLSFRPPAMPGRVSRANVTSVIGSRTFAISPVRLSAADPAHLEKVVADRTAMYGRDHDAVVDALMNQAIGFHTRGDMDNALKIAQQAADMSNRLHGDMHADSSDLYALMTNIMYKKQEYDQALIWGNRASAATILRRGPDADQLFGIYVTLALCNQAKGQFMETLKLTDQAFTVRHSEEDAVVATAHNLRSAAALFTGDSATALEAGEKALSLREKYLGPKHWDIVVSLNGLALCHRQTMNFKKAEEYAQRSLDMALELRGNDTVLCDVYSNMATIHYYQGNFNKAIDMALKPFEIEKNPDSPVLIAAHSALAMSYMKKGDSTKALEHSRRDLALARKYLPANHPEIWAKLANQALIHATCGNTGLARDAAEQVLSMIPPEVPGHSPAVYLANSVLSMVHQTNKDYPKAIEITQKLITALKVTGQPSMDEATHHMRLMMMFMEMRRFREAADACEEAHATFSKILPPGHPALQETKGRLERLRSMAQ